MHELAGKSLTALKEREGPNASDGDDLRREVESLLESHEAAGDFIEWPAADVATALLAEHDSGLRPGLVVGRYKIIRLLAEGGMGQVYLARDTTQLARPAAIKVLQHERASLPGRGLRRGG